jgi:hypothetical protein
MPEEFASRIQMTTDMRRATGRGLKKEELN